MPTTATRSSSPAQPSGFRLESRCPSAWTVAVSAMSRAAIHRFRKGSDNRRVVPVDDDRGVASSGCHLQALVCDPIEFCPESLLTDPRPGRGKRGTFSHRHEGPARRPDGTRLRHRLPVASDDEGFTGGDHLDHPGVVSEHALCDGPCHGPDVARRTTRCKDAQRGPRSIGYPGRPLPHARGRATNGGSPAGHIESRSAHQVRLCARVGFVDARSGDGGSARQPAHWLCPQRSGPTSSTGGCQPAGGT